MFPLCAADKICFTTALMFIAAEAIVRLAAAQTSGFRAFTSSGETIE